MIKSFKNFLLNENREDGYEIRFFHFKYDLENLHENVFEPHKELWVKDPTGKASNGEFYLTSTKYGGSKKQYFYKAAKQSLKQIYGANAQLKDYQFAFKNEPQNLPQNYFRDRHAALEYERAKEVGSILGKHYTFPTTEHLYRIKNYTDSSYDLNKSLFNKAKDPTYQISQPIQKSIQLMDETMQHNVTPIDITVHTGMKRSPEDMKEHYSLKDGKHFRIHLPAYTSTSLVHEKARSFGRPIDDSKYGLPGKRYAHILSLKVPKGSHGVYVEHITRVTGEHEFILPRDSKIHISAKPRVNHKHQLVTWYGHLADDGFKHTEKFNPQMNFFRKLISNKKPKKVSIPSNKDLIADRKENNNNHFHPNQKELGLTGGYGYKNT